MCQSRIVKRTVPQKEIDRAIELYAIVRSESSEASPRREYVMARKSKSTTDAIETIYRRLYQGDPERVKGLEEARANDAIARTIFNLRTKAAESL